MTMRLSRNLTLSFTGALVILGAVASVGAMAGRKAPPSSPPIQSPATGNPQSKSPTQQGKTSSPGPAGTGKSSAPRPTENTTTRPPVSTSSSGSGPTQQSSPAMTNDDVVQLVRAGFAEELVIARILQAPSKTFDLSVRGMLDLKALGVSDRLMTIMLGGADPGATKGSSGAAVNVPESPDAVASALKVPGIYVQEGGVFTPLELTVVSSGGTSAGNLLMSGLTFGLKKAKIKVRVQGNKAPVRVGSNVEFFFSGPDFNPGQFVLARLEVNDNNRELVSAETGALGVRGGIRDKDQIPVDVRRLDSGVYRLRTTQPLRPGEYAFFNEKLWPFGVDR